MPYVKTLAIAAAGLALSCGAASAQALSGANLNMRAGPGTNYAVVGVIPQGAPVEVRQCVASWCEVAFQGATGYASRNYLDMDTMTGQMGRPAPSGMYGQPGRPAGGMMEPAYRPAAPMGSTGPTGRMPQGGPTEPAGRGGPPTY